MSFDPNNPRGAPGPQTPSSPKPPSYMPPQPVNPGPSRLLIAGLVAIAILLVGIAILIVFSLFHGESAASPTPSPASSASAGTPAPTVAGSPSGSSVPSGVPPTSRPSTSGPGSQSPASALLAHVPESLRATCTEQTAASSPGIDMASCTASSGQIQVTYSMYATTDLMSSAYEDEFTQVQIDQSSGACEDPNTWPAEGVYEVEGTPAGRALCTNTAGVPNILWTDDQLTIMTSATDTSGDAAGLVQFWLTEAGPIP